MAAELRLGVSFDLVYFRQQLQKLSRIASSEFTAPIKIRLDRQVVDQELTRLEKAFQRRTYRINIADAAVTAARTRVVDLAKELANLRRSVTTPIVIPIKYETVGSAPGRGAGPVNRAVKSAVGSQSLVDRASYQELQALYKFAKEAQLPFEQLKRGAASSTEELRRVLGPAFRGVGKDVKAGIKAGLANADSELAKLGAQLGDNLLGSVKKALGIASPSREFKKIGEDSGEGLEQGLKAGIGEAARLGVQEIRSLFKALQNEARSGTAQLQAMMIGAMAGVVQLPGGRQQRGRLLQTGTGINNAMTGPALGNIQARQSAVRGGAQGAAAATPAFAAALPLMFGMDPRELTARLQGLYGQQYRAPSMGGYQTARPGVVANLLAALSSSRGGFGAGTGVNQRGFTGGAINPGILSSGYIGRSAISPGFVNYPPGMPPAYGTGFIGTPGAAYGMAPGRMQGPALPVRGVFSTANGSLGQFPSAGMMGPASPRGSMGQFPMAGMHYPSSPLGTINAQSSMFGANGPGGGWFGGFRNYGGGGGGGGGGFGGLSGFGDAASGIANAAKNLPGKGLVREIGEEFGFAAKQVLLFGTTYKALAFLTNFPAQVGQAVGQLQSFRNTLDAISPSAQEAAKSNEFILATVDKYNVPLQSARDGFTRLYASMQPAGFGGEEIRNLFSGISKAAATFGMSADKVDRVNYAFAQMASKGQIMSEELKGQLGDVLPGAMGIFAEAAGFKGPKAIQDFGKALEDGAFKGKAMRALLNNVAIEMNKEFGPGAEGAAKTFQGAMNRMANSTKLLYEAFEPVAVGFLNSIVVPLTGGLKQLTDGFNAFFTGSQATTAGGQELQQKLTSLLPTFEGLLANAKLIAGQLGEMAKGFLVVAEVALRFLSLPIVGYLASTYAQVLLLVGAFNLLGGSAILGAVASAGRFIGTLLALGAQAIASTAMLAQTTAGTVAYKAAMAQAEVATKTFGTMLKALAGRTILAVALVAIGALISRVLELKGAIDSIKNSAKQALAEISTLANAGAVGTLQNRAKDVQKQIQSFESLKPFVQGGAFGPKQALTPEAAKKMQDLGLGGFIGKDVFGKQYIKDFVNASNIIQEKLKALGKESDKVKEKLPLAEKIAADLKAKADKPPATQDVKGLMGGKEKTTSLESFYGLEDQLAKEFTQAELDRQQAMHDHRVALMKSYFDIQDARSNSYQKEALQFERTMREIQLKKEGALLAASREVLQAQGSVAGGAVIPGMVGRTGGAVNQDPTTRGRSSGPHLHAQGAGMSEQQLATLVDKYLDLGGRAASSYGRSRGAGGHGYNAIDFLTPQGTPISLKQGASISQYGPAGGRGGLMAQVTTPEGSFQLGHLSALSPAAAGAGVSAGAARKVGANEKRDIVAQQKTQLAMAKESLVVRQAEEQAIQEAQVALENYIASILPTSEQELQNQILEKKNQLIASGLPESVIEREMRLYEIQQKTSYGLAAVERLKKAGILTDEQAANAANRLNQGLSQQNKLINDNSIALENNRLAKERSDIAKQMEFAGAGLRAGFIGPSARRYEEGRMQGESDATAREMASLTQELEMVQLAADSLENTALGIGDAFAQSFSDIITGAQTAQAALGQFFSNIAKSFADMAAQMIAKWLIMKAVGLVASMFPTSAPTQSVAPNIQSGGDFNLPEQISVGMATAANGAVWPGGFQAFANGGIVNGPTLGLVGEGRFNEAVVPLPDGRKIPVELGGAAGNNISSNIVVNVNNGQASSDVSGSGGQSLGRELEGAVRNVILRESRPGGIIYSQR